MNTRLRQQCRIQGQLGQQFKPVICRYREVISLPFPPMAIASLRAVCQRCCTPLLVKLTNKRVLISDNTDSHEKRKNEKHRRKVEVLHLFRWFTHTPHRSGVSFCGAERLEVAKGRSLSNGLSENESKCQRKHAMESKALIRFLRELHFMCRWIARRLASQLMSSKSQHGCQIRQLLSIHGGEVPDGSRSRSLT